MRFIRTILAVLAGSFIIHAATASAFAQTKFPNRPIRIIIPFAPGGGLDVVARIVSQRVSEKLGQPIIIESRPGAGGAIAVNELMRSAPDGYTLLMVTSAHATLPTLNKLSWHPSDDFSPIANIYFFMYVIATNTTAAANFRTLSDFLKYVRANPGKVNWGSSGIGGPQHLAGTQFAKLARIDMVHVPYRGNAPLLQALIANEIQLVFDTPTIITPHIQAGRLVALAVTGENRMTKLPEIPTVLETGLVDYSNQAGAFILGPKGMPQDLQLMLNREFAAALDEPAVRTRLQGLGLTVPASAQNSIADVKKYIDGFQSVYGKLIIEMGIKAE